MTAPHDADDIQPTGPDFAANLTDDMHQTISRLSERNAFGWKRFASAGEEVTIGHVSIRVREEQVHDVIFSRREAHQGLINQHRRVRGDKLNAVRAHAGGFGEGCGVVGLHHHAIVPSSLLGCVTARSIPNQERKKREEVAIFLGNM